MTEPPGRVSRVPIVTLYFWIIKILCTTVGETAADYLNEELGLGLSLTASVMTGALIIALYFQFRAARYVPPVYWLVVVLVSIVGTLITDELTDEVGVPLSVSTFCFGVALAGLFALWYATERTLSIRAIVNARRETLYWAAVLLTFALGTAAGDWLGEGLGLGYLTTAVLIGGVIAAVALAHRHAVLHPVLAFWIAYILTRPFGASLGDYLAQDAGGLGLGPTLTSAAFLVAILVIVTYLGVTRSRERQAELDDGAAHVRSVDARAAAMSPRHR